MALNVKKRDEKKLKSDKMIEEALNQGKISETSSKVILEELNNEIYKSSTATSTDKQENTVAETIVAPAPKTTEHPKKVGRKKKYLEERDLIHIRVTPSERKDIEMAIFARSQNMQDYLMDLIREDMKKNKDKYANIYNTLNSFRKELN